MDVVMMSCHGHEKQKADLRLNTLMVSEYIEWYMYVVHMHQYDILFLNKH